MEPQLITIQFEVFSKVRIIELDRPGRVECVSYDGNIVMYKVSCWIDGDRKVFWVYAWEIESV